MNEFNYIIEKIDKTSFIEKPFKYLYIENFLSQEHFDLITKDNQINLEKQPDTETLVAVLLAKDYKPVVFPGCTTDIKEYLKWFNSERQERFKYDLLEGFGISFRIQKYHNDTINNLIEFLNSDNFHNFLKDKFKKTRPTRIETAIQKYMSGYEISPHPDVRKKCLTYMLNVNTDKQSEQIDIHTHFLEFTDRYKKLYDYWKENVNTDRCWVPWVWCDSKFKQIKNNSITIFAPDNNTLHGVKLDYDHCQFQRTQIYGNLWYTDYTPPDKPNWKKLPV